MRAALTSLMLAVATVAMVTLGYLSIIEVSPVVTAQEVAR
jgi:hypothetical protein